MDKVLKQFVGILKDANSSTHTATVIVSTDSVDRDGDIIPPEAFKKRIKEYKKHPVLLSSHDYRDLTKQIGKAQSIKVTDAGLEVKFEWFVGSGNDEADWGWVLATKDIAAFSVGFMAHAWEDGTWDEQKQEYKDGVHRKFTDIELLEVSQVLIPSNRDAVMGRMPAAQGVEKELLELAIKSFGWEKKDDGDKGFPNVNKAKDKQADDKATADRDKDSSGNPDPEVESKELREEIAKLYIEIGVCKKQISDLESAVIELKAVIEFDKEGEVEDVKAREVKHYTDILLGEGSKDSIPTPTKEDVRDVMKDILTIK